jgi:acetylxylan esterase
LTYHSYTPTHKAPSSRKRTRLLIAGAVAALAATAIGVGTASAVSAPASPCAAVHVLAARASTEAPGAGVIGSLVRRIQNGVSSSVSTSAVDYPALLAPYDSSSTAGDTATRKQLTDQVKQCPDQKIVLVGYSQGAQIIGDALAGGGGAAGLGGASDPVPAAVSSHVTAMIQFGDPRHQANQSFNQGTAKGATGLFPRRADQSLAPFARITQSFCDTGDPFCARGANVTAHLIYDTKYDSAASAFVIGKLRAAGVS